jgi:large subunit ribosomal protein L9
MKVLLIKDVYKLGRAGDVKKVANGYGRNYLIPQGLAVLATPGALKQVERIRSQADAERVVLNQEMGQIAEKLVGVQLVFPVKAGETGKLYGSVTPQMVADAVNEQAGTEITRRQIESQPIRTIGVHNVGIRLTMDLIPEVSVVVHREGEAPETAAVEAEAIAEAGMDDFDITADVAELDEDIEAAAGEAAFESLAEGARAEVEEDNDTPVENDTSVQDDTPVEAAAENLEAVEAQMLDEAEPLDEEG